MSYTIINLRESEDSAPKFGLEKVGEAHFPREELGAETTGLAYHVVNPNMKQAFGHRHERAEEIYVVLEGSGRIRLDDELRDIAEHDAVRVEPAVARGLEAGPAGLTVLVFGPRHAGDGEMLPDFWG
jgi:mannose-6-phosphate isomerase-like protein (cupin superfamily)